MSFRLCGRGSEHIKGMVAAALWVSLYGFHPSVAAGQALGRTNPNGGLFPDSSLVDFRFLLDAPAGKHGFLRAEGGRFVWPNGRRARFYGVNISSRSVWVDSATVDRVVETLARAGCNMVRFEALDSYGGLTEIEGSGSTRKLNPDRLKQLDYWMARLRERGIYYYLDLLDFRQFKSGDEVPGWDRVGRAAKPYAFFDRRMIDLQKEFARQLLTHRNPLIGLAYKDDPALALVEICNEHGLFMKADKLDSLVEPYGAVLRQEWGRWLTRKYGSRAALQSAWGMAGAAPVLQPQEDPASGSVMLPNFAPVPGPPPVGPPAADDPVDVRRAATRMRDGVRFLYEVQRGYFREMRAALRDIGVKVPITAAVSNEIVPDVASAAAELDFTSENYYADHPTFAGKEWEGTHFYNDSNPLRSSTTYQIAPWLSALRWEGKPVVVREWATVWPNRYRALAVPEMAAYASLQNLDAVLLFGYQVVRTPDTLSDFDHQCDPTVWGLFGMGAKAFLRGDIRPSAQTATIEYSPDTLFRWPNELTNLYRLAWFVRINSVFVPRAIRPAVQARASGRVSTHSRATRPASQTRAPDQVSTRSRLASRGEWRRSSPTSAGLPGRIPPEAAASLSALLTSYAHAGLPVHPSMLETGALTTSTAEVVRRTQDGLLVVNTPRFLAVAGELPVNRAVELGAFTLVSPTPIGALMAVSLDGKSLRESRRFVVKMVSRAENTGQVQELAPTGAPGRYFLKDWGKAPVVTFGKPSVDPLKLRRGNETLLTLGLVEGAWELLVRDGAATLVCDTAGIPGTLAGRAITTAANTPLTVDNRKAAERSAPR